MHPSQPSTRSNPAARHLSRNGGINHMGLWLAALAGTAGVVIIVLAWKGTPTQAPKQTIAATPQPQAIDVPAGKANRALRNLGKGEELFVQMADKNDPTRVAGQLSAARSTPLEGKRYKMEQPRVWSFLRDGRTIYLEADSGQALIPDMTGSRPEDGAIQGHVIAKIFAKTPDGALPDPAKVPAQLTLSSDELRFDLRSGEFLFPGEVTLIGPRIDFLGSDVLILVDESSQRLELLKVAKTKRCIIIPEATPPTARAAASPAASNAPSVTIRQAAYQPPVAPVETYFSITLDEKVSVTQGGRSLQSDLLTGYVRLVNNELREGAIKGGSPASPKRGAAAHSPQVINASYQPTPPAVPTAPPAAKAPEPIVLSWSGPMELKSMKQAPAELARDDMFLRCTAAADGGVVVRDAEQSVMASGRMLQYFTTTQAAAIEGTPSSPARMERTGAGHAIATRFDADPTTGTISAAGAGYLEGSMKATPEAKKPDRLSWQTGAAFLFGLDDDGKGAKRMSSRLASIALKGDVRASSGSNAGGLSGDALDASFTAVDAANSYLSRVLVTGNAKAWDDKDGRLESGLLDITLANVKGSTQSQPVAIKAGGGVKAVQKDSTLAASTVDVTLEQRAAENGRFSTAVAKAVAGGDVRFERSDGVKASTPLLTAMPLEQNVILSGPGSWVGQNATSIKGNTITMHGVNRTLAVEGPGEFTHTQPAAKGETRPEAKANVTWAQGMTFDDRTGLVTCTGSAEALLTRGTLEKDTIKAQRVEVAIGPAPEKSPETNPQKPKGTGPDLGLSGSDRPLLWALATGDQNPASIELRRYDPAAAGSILKLMYLEGATIRADNTSGRVDVPGKGKLLTVDRERTAEAAAAQGLADSRLAGDSKGTALFAWDGSMMFDRASGTAVLTTLVTVTHKALSDGLVTQLRCDALTAQLESPPASGVDGGGGVTGGPAFAGALRSAEARGQVWLSSRDSEMVAQTLSFDTVSRTVTAKGGANPADLVTVTGQNGAAPVSAHEIFWNLGDNSMRLIGAQPVTAPR